MIILWFLLGLIGFTLFLIILLIILLLLVPFRFEISARREGILEGQGTVSWLGRSILVKLDFAFKHARAAVKMAGFPVYTIVLWPREGIEVKEAKVEAKPRRVGKIKVPIKERVAMWRDKAPKIWARVTRVSRQFSAQVLYELLRLVLRMARSLKLKAELKGEIGLSDPAATGMFFGLYHAVRVSLRLKALDVKANFEEACLKGSAQFSGRLWIGALAFNALRFAFARSIRRIWISELKALIFHGGG